MYSLDLIVVFCSSEVIIAAEGIYLAVKYLLFKTKERLQVGAIEADLNQLKTAWAKATLLKGTRKKRILKGIVLALKKEMSCEWFFFFFSKNVLSNLRNSREGDTGMSFKPFLPEMDKI